MVGREEHACVLDGSVLEEHLRTDGAERVVSVEVPEQLFQPAVRKGNDVGIHHRQHRRAGRRRARVVRTGIAAIACHHDEAHRQGMEQVETAEDMLDVLGLLGAVEDKNDLGILTDPGIHRESRDLEAQIVERLIERDDHRYRGREGIGPNSMISGRPMPAITCACNSARIGARMRLTHWSSACWGGMARSAVARAITGSEVCSGGTSGCCAPDRSLSRNRGCRSGTRPPGCGAMVTKPVTRARFAPRSISPGKEPGRGEDVRAGAVGLYNLDGIHQAGGIVRPASDQDTGMPAERGVDLGGRHGSAAIDPQRGDRVRKLRFKRIGLAGVVQLRQFEQQVFPQSRIGRRARPEPLDKGGRAASRIGDTAHRHAAGPKENQQVALDGRRRAVDHGVQATLLAFGAVGRWGRTVTRFRPLDER